MAKSRPSGLTENGGMAGGLGFSKPSPKTIPDNSVKEQYNKEVKTTEKIVVDVDQTVEKDESNKSTEKIKTTKSKSTKKRVANDYWKNFYNVRVDFPTDAKEPLQVAGNYYGSIKEYIISLVTEDLKKNYSMYLEGRRPEEDDDFFKKLANKK